MNKVVANIYKAHKESNKPAKPKADVDVEAFIEREATFQKKLMEGGSVNNG